MSSTRRAKLQALEEGFDLSVTKEKMPEYSALRDKALRKYFESKKIQNYLLRIGLIDNDGRIVDLEKHKAKLHIIEQEFKRAEQEEFWRQREEQELRKRVQKKRYDAIDIARIKQRMHRLKEDRQIQAEIRNASSQALIVSRPLKRKVKRKNKK